MKQLKPWLALSLGAALLTACTHGLVANPSTVLSTGARALAVVPAPEVVEIPSPNFNDRKGSPITAIVLHHTAVAADARSTAQFFANPKSQVSSHYIVDRDGTLIRCVADDQRAWHAGKSSFLGQGDVNTFSIGIEISNVGDGVQPYPKAQVDAVVKLVAYLSQTYHIDMDHVTRHRDIALPAGRKTDTSNNFDEAYVKSAVQALLAGRQAPRYSFKPAPSHYDPTQQRYTVLAGDTFSSIADQVYDTPAMDEAIAHQNPGVTLQPGAVLSLPTSYN